MNNNLKSLPEGIVRIPVRFFNTFSMVKTIYKQVCLMYKIEQKTWGSLNGE